jgi:hypothetical protein
LPTDWVRAILLLTFYNVIYCAPLFALVAARAALTPEQSNRLFGRLRSLIDWAFARLLPPLLAIAAVTLAVDALRRL